VERDLLSVKRYKVKQRLNELKNLKGRGTELISLFIKPNKQISDTINMLREEWSTSSNIKSDITRKHVQNAITKIIQRCSHKYILIFIKDLIKLKILLNEILSTLYKLLDLKNY